jgi:hypothetical protein
MNEPERVILYQCVKAMEVAQPLVNDFGRAGGGRIWEAERLLNDALAAAKILLDDVRKELSKEKR